MLVSVFSIKFQKHADRCPILETRFTWPMRSNIAYTAGNGALQALNPAFGPAAKGAAAECTAQGKALDDMDIKGGQIQNTGPVPGFMLDFVGILVNIKTD